MNIIILFLFIIIGRTNVKISSATQSNFPPLGAIYVNFSFLYLPEQCSPICALPWADPLICTDLGHQYVGPHGPYSTPDLSHLWIVKVEWLQH